VHPWLLCGGGSPLGGRGQSFFEFVGRIYAIISINACWYMSELKSILVSVPDRIFMRPLGGPLIETFCEY